MVTRGTAPASIERRVARVRHALEASATDGITIRFSCGQASLLPAADPEAALPEADPAMYRAKRSSTHNG